MHSLRFYLFRAIMPVLRRLQSYMLTPDLRRIVRVRATSQRLADRLIRLPQDVSITNGSLGEVPGDWFTPRGFADNAVMLYFHGGGVMFGWSNANRRILAHICRSAGMRAFGIDYRVAPEHSYPAAHEDCLKAYHALVSDGDPLVLIGESSGGVLALATMLRARDQGLPLPNACMLLSPTVDYAFEDLRDCDGEDVFVTSQFVIDIHKPYMADQDLRITDFSPVHADLNGLPPLFVMVGEHDILRPQAERLVGAAQDQGLSVELVIWPDVWHGWHVFCGEMPEAARSLQAFGRQVRHLVTHGA